jgi:ABC-type Fe3+/spermidine/putrescine transport system ATPase subunit
MSKGPKLTIEQKFDLVRKEAKETYNMFVEQTECFESYMDKEDLDWKDDLEDEIHRIRKALKSKIKVKGGKEVKMVDRPTTAEYLNTQVKRLKKVCKDMEDLFSVYIPSDEDSNSE